MGGLTGGGVLAIDSLMSFPIVVFVIGAARLDDEVGNE
jgi:hypothetical protein